MFNMALSGVIGHVHQRAGHCPSMVGVDRLSAWPIIGADITHFTDYRYRPFSKHLPIILIFFIMQTNILFTGDIIYWCINNTGEII